MIGFIVPKYFLSILFFYFVRFVKMLTFAMFFVDYPFSEGEVKYYMTEDMVQKR